MYTVSETEEGVNGPESETERGDCAKSAAEFGDGESTTAGTDSVPDDKVPLPYLGSIQEQDIPSITQLNINIAYSSL